MTILWLGEEHCHDVQRVGGKAANLSRLAADYRVPAGFCITPELYVQWLNGLEQESAPQGTPPRDLRDAVRREYREMTIM